MELVERHLPRIRRLLAALLNGSAEDMADAEQEILVGLWVGLDRFRFASSFRTFLYRFCRNKAIDLLRREGRHRRRGEAAARAAVTAVPADPADPGDGLEREVERILRQAMDAELQVRMIQIRRELAARKLIGDRRWLQLRELLKRLASVKERAAAREALGRQGDGELDANDQALLQELSRLLGE